MAAAKDGQPVPRADLPEALTDRWVKELEGDLTSFEDRRIAGLLFSLRLRLKGGPDLAAQLALAHTLGPGHREGDPLSSDAREIVVTKDYDAHLKRLRELEGAWVVGKDVVDELYRLELEAWRSQEGERE